MAIPNDVPMIGAQTQFPLISVVTVLVWVDEADRDTVLETVEVCVDEADRD